MSKAFNDALERLQLSRIRPDQESERVREDLALRIEWVRETLALRIIESVQQRGERDPIRLREDALTYLAQAKPPTDKPNGNRSESGESDSRQTET